MSAGFSVQIAAALTLIRLWWYRTRFEQCTKQTCSPSPGNRSSRSVDRRPQLRRDTAGLPESSIQEACCNSIAFKSIQTTNRQYKPSTFSRVRLVDFAALSHIRERRGTLREYVGVPLITSVLRRHVRPAMMQKHRIRVVVL